MSTLNVSPDPGRIATGIVSRLGRPLAALAWWSFVTALVSGAVLSFNYTPTGDVFVAVSKLTHFYPFGVFFRKLHFLSGQFFLLCIIIHILDHFFKGTYLRMKPLRWTRLVCTVIPVFLLMFTGFVLKGDKEGIFAGEIMMHLAREIPMIGSLTADLLIRPGQGFFLRPYLYHTVILPFLIIFLLGHHQRSLLSEKKLGISLLAGLMVAAVLWPLPVDITPRADVPFVSGPWFFQGIQFLLRYTSPFWAGIVWPLAPVTLMACLPFAPAAWAKGTRRLVIVLWLFHLGLLIVAWAAMPWLCREGG